jgi:hypothetical protein
LPSEPRCGVIPAAFDKSSYRQPNRARAARIWEGSSIRKIIGADQGSLRASWDFIHRRIW